MKNLERILLGWIIGAVPPLIGFLAAWWIAYAFLPERLVILSSALGLLAGLAVDLCYLKSWILRAFSADLRIWMAIYLFYSICCFGFFMGVPAFNLLLAIPAGYIVGSRLGYHQADDGQVRRRIRQTRLFTTLVLGLICLASAAIALGDPYTGANLQGMFKLGFEVTPAMIVGIIVLGGGALLGAQWWMTAKMIRLAYRLAGE